MTNQRPVLLVALVAAVALCAALASAQSTYNFVVDPNQSTVTIDFSVSDQDDPWIESTDSSSVQGAWQAQYTPGTGDLDTVSIRNGAIVLNEDLTVGGSKRIAVIEIAVGGTLRNARLEFVEPSDEADIDSNGEAALTGHKLRLTGTFDYEWGIECDFGTTEGGEGTQEIDIEVPAPTDYATTPHQNVQAGQTVTGSFDCLVSETFTCNLFWELDIGYDIVATAVVPGAADPAPAAPGSNFAVAQCMAVEADGHFTASTYNYGVGRTINWVDTYGDQDLLYNLLPGTWTAIVVYDHTAGEWVSAQYAMR